MKLNINAAIFLVASLAMIGAGISVLIDSGWPLIVTAVFLLGASVAVDVDRGDE